MKVFRTALFCFATAAAAGCATLSRDECLTADWYGIGVEDGLQGYPLTRISGHRKACARHGVTVDMDAYRDGHEAGAREFCRPQNGYQLGRSGKSYPGICPDDLEDEFVAAYRNGIQIWGIQTKLNSEKKALQRTRTELATVQGQLQEKQAHLIAEGTDAATRLLLLNETQQLAEQQGALENRIRTHEQNIARLQERLRQTEQQSPYTH